MNAVADQFVMVKFSFEPMQFERMEVPVILYIIIRHVGEVHIMKYRGKEPIICWNASKLNKR